ncbi:MULTISPECIES: DUF4362 domain-containing protein [Anoxybacillaceae]|uniref:DUF4362 domain-containing protein n=1 Tax=Thermaerobacillus caldiproteolyticus TaxID=247480 RepID=A0A7V9Z827_9BACL|nr:DUF4362 domain-containing protein [Anoxybacillus caldiproteolyticus]MBA2875780.1 hypothetical protein [Anoxybacillus caldiproteolyticus]MED0654654.1 DUF4362 domain-containing protein [Anoxybacillus geothermalis]
MKKIICFMLIMLLLSSCGEYEPSKDDIVNKHGDITNLGKFMQFVENVNRGKEDKIRIVAYTVEGDPIIQDLEYDGESITLITDTTRDKFGSGSINTSTCKSIKIEKTQERTDYLLDGCDQESTENIVLVIWNK